MKSGLHYLAAPIATAMLLWSSVVEAADVAMMVDAAKPSHAISPRLYGIFFEDINFGGDGGVNAELVKNGAFEFPLPLMGWAEVSQGTSRGEFQALDQDPASAANTHFLRVRAGTDGVGYGVANEGFRGIGVRADEPYQFSVRARTADAASPRMRVAVIAEDGAELAAADLDNAGPQWSDMSAALHPRRTEANAKLVIALQSPGTVDLDFVSLCPEATWKHRPHGLRADLVQKLADLKPAFLRFPGGCIVEGSELKYRYQWKNTIGDRNDRRLIINRWNNEFAHRLTPDYFQSFRLGFFEFFQLAEDIGAEPLPILNCGMACQFNSGELVPIDALGPYIQDALDLIEFANGPTSSVWGAKRAAMGHPEPFGMKLLGVGNEQWDQQYFDRYEIFAKELKARHPEIQLVSGAGPFPADKHFQFAWPLLRALKADIVDEHCYAMPDWFLRSATRYDDYDRNGPKVFMGEYAAQSVDICSPDNRNNLRCALAEAAYMTGLERNSDVVVMSSYAPLFGHEEAWQWRPNLIWFDSLKSYVTPNYYVQQLFSQNRGDEVLPVEIKDDRPHGPPAGRVGLATTQASVEFKDLHVVRDRESLLDWKSLADPQAVTQFRGQWQTDDDTIRQADPKATGRFVFGDQGWRDYTFSVKARRLGGRGGFAVIVRNSSGGSFLQWNVGGADNQQDTLQANLATHSEEDTSVDRRPRSIESNRWYDVKVELEGSRVRCFLDGELVHDVDLPSPALPALFVAASRDGSSGEVILKVVNPTERETKVDLQLSGVTKINSPAKSIVLKGAPEDANSLAEPNRVKPHAEELGVSGAAFAHIFPASSLTVLRMGVE